MSALSGFVLRSFWATARRASAAVPGVRVAHDGQQRLPVAVARREALGRHLEHLLARRRRDLLRARLEHVAQQPRAVRVVRLEQRLGQRSDRVLAHGRRRPAIPSAAPSSPFARDTTAAISARRLSFVVASTLTSTRAASAPSCRPSISSTKRARSTSGCTTQLLEPLQRLVREVDPRQRVERRLRERAVRVLRRLDQRADHLLARPRPSCRAGTAAR